MRFLLGNDLGLEFVKVGSGGEHAVTRACYRQVDDAYNKEAEELAEMMKKNQEKAGSKMGGKSDEKSKEKPSPQMARPVTDPGRSICIQRAF